MIAQLPCLLSKTDRAMHMMAAVASGNKWLWKWKRFRLVGRLSIVGYGPSLEDTWQEIKHPILATSGAYDYLLERGVVADYYAAVDPWPAAVDLLRSPKKETTYLIASQCDPAFWELLKGFDVRIWHTDDMESLELIREIHPSGMNQLVGGGSTIANRSLNLGAALGYRRFDMYGVDCSYVRARHAGVHTGKVQQCVTVAVGDRTFKTTPQLVQSAREFHEFLTSADAEVRFHGDGLMAELARTIKRGEKNG